MNLESLFADRLAGSAQAVASVTHLAPMVAAAAECLIERLATGGTLYTCGNGGSAAEALHLAEELTGRYRAGPRRALRAVSLAADPTALTCIANDFGFDRVFSRQCEALLTDRDVLAVLSTSGNSPNIVEALRVARSRSCATIGLLGHSGGACRALCDHAIVVPADDSAHVQEAHLVIVHLFCEALEHAAQDGPIVRAAPLRR